MKCVGSGVHEYRIDFGPGYRMYFGKDGERVVLLLGGGTKKRQQKDIADAHRRWQDYKRRKKLGDSIVALTRDFKETIQARARRDSAFRKELLREAVESLRLCCATTFMPPLASTNWQRARIIHPRA